jgi:hypothetical protein
VRVELTDDAVAWLAIGAAGGASVAMVLALLAINGQRRVRRAYRVFSGGHSEDILTLLQRYITELHALREDVAAVGQYGDHVRDLLAGAVTRVATVRYDAFEDMGGHLSYSTAFLDERGNGVVLTAINGRSETRTYAKPVEAGGSPHTLSDEEAAVVAQALGDGDQESSRAKSGTGAK